MDYCHIESEDLLRVGHRLDDTFEVLSEKRLDFALDPRDAFIARRVRLLQPQVDLDEGLCIVSFGAELCLRWALKRGNDLRAAKCVAKLQLAVGVKG